MYDMARETVQQGWLLLGQMAPYLLFGFFAAGILSVLISPELVARHLGGHSLWAVCKASLFGVPLPLCSCGVIPVAAFLRRHGASRAATTSFLLSTPQTGVDSIAATYALLGPVFAVFRPVSAFLTGVVGGVLVRVFAREEGPDSGGQKAEECAEPCCAPGGSGGAARRALRYGFITLPKDIGVPLLIGAAIAGAMSALVPAESLSGYLGGGIGSMALLALVGVPVYVCATASIPIAVGFMHFGASPGAALAFLIAGPATNAATFATVWRVTDKRTVCVYLLTVALSAVGCGMLLDGLYPLAMSVAPEAHRHCHESARWWHHAAAVVLLAVLWTSRRAGRAGGAAATGLAGAGVGERTVLRISGMTCAHCAESVRAALAACSGVSAAAVDLAAGTAEIHGMHVRGAELCQAAENAGYAAQVMDEEA